MAYTETYVSPAGSGAHDGSSTSNEWTIAEAAAITTGGLRFNLKPGTYTLGANLTMGNATTENPQIWQGYNSSPGDLKTRGRTSATGPLSTTNVPVIDGVALYGITAGTYNTFADLKFAGSRSSSSGLLYMNAAGSSARRCTGENTGTGGNNGCIHGGTNYGSIFDCDMSSASTASSLVICSVGRGVASGCRFWCTGSPHDSSTAVSLANFGSMLSNSIIYNIGRAVLLGANSDGAANNSIYSVVDAFVLDDNASLIYANVCGTVTGYLFKGATSSGNPQAIKNASTTPGSGRIDTSGAGTIIAESDAISLSGTPFTNAASGDFTLNNTAGGGADCRAASGIWGGHRDLGAVQHQESGGVSIINSRSNSLSLR